jgi:2-keto-3-deoxy-L-rhamnonate aldolase RhmA
MAADDAWARDYRAKGFRALAYGIDVLLMQGALAQGLARLREAEGTKR